MERQKIEEIKEYLNSRAVSVRFETKENSDVILNISDYTEYLPSTSITNIREIWGGPVLVGIRKGWLQIVLCHK